MTENTQATPRYVIERGASIIVRDTLSGMVHGKFANTDAAKKAIRQLERKGARSR